MSRIIVKQLPKNITEGKLRELFGSKGTITDLKLKYTPDGKFRQFCFIGYSSEEEAEAAVKYYNNTCIQTTRIKVELCAALGSEEKPKAWSKHSKEVQLKAAAQIANEREKKEKKSTEKIEKNKTIDEILGKHKDDPEFQEFMMAHDRNRQLWANDADLKEQNKEHDADSNAEDVEEVENENEAASDSGLDDHGEVSDGDEEDEEKSSDETKLAEKPISDLEYMKTLMAGPKKNEKVSENKTKNESKAEKASLDLFTIKIRNVPYKTKRQDIQKFFKPLKPYSIRLPAQKHGFCYVGFKTTQELSKALLKHKSFIKGIQVFITDFTEKNKKTKELKKTLANDAANKPINSKWAQQAASLEGEESIAESGCIFFRNLSFTVTDDDIQKLFEKFGPIAEISLPVDSLTRQIKGFGTVTFMMPEHAVQAFNKLDGIDFHGRLLHLLPAKSKQDDADKMDENEASLSFKQKKALKLKKSAQNTATWNTLFLGANAVAEILSKKFNMSKEKILDTSDGGSSAAVRIALGETQIVIEMKQFLEENNVHLNAFDALNLKRSKTVILVKNLPADTCVEELTPIFSKFGVIGRLILPPSGVTALIEYTDPTEARNAFKKLAFSKFKHVPLFLEWAPEDVFTKTLSGETAISEQQTVKPERSETVKEAENKEAKDEELVTDEKPNVNGNNNDNADLDDDEIGNAEPEPNTTLFLRNLNFKTVQDTIYEHFKHLGPIHTVEVAKRKDPENPRILKSLGYGFIQFKKNATAEQALKNMQMTSIDGNAVELKRSDRTLKTQHTTARRRIENTKQIGTKILVRNIPFQTKEKEVRDIFKAFGELRSVRLPKKTAPGETNHIRGFGFVDYLTKSDAKKAFQALSQSTHLYGRRLVLEWAANDEQQDVEELRKQTAEQYEQQRQNKTGRRGSKRAVFDMDKAMSKMPRMEEENEGF